MLDKWSTVSCANCNKDIKIEQYVDIFGKSNFHKHCLTFCSVCKKEKPNSDSLCGYHKCCVNCSEKECILCIVLNLPKLLCNCVSCGKSPYVYQTQALECFHRVCKTHTQTNFECWTCPGKLQLLTVRKFKTL